MQDIEEARAHGDLRENAEFSAAKERQAFIEGRMREIEGLMALSDVIDPAKLSGTRVVFGATVRLTDGESGDEITYSIVGDHEADIRQNRLAISAPMLARVDRPRGRRHRGPAQLPRARANTRSSRSASNPRTEPSVRWWTGYPGPVRQHSRRLAWTSAIIHGLLHASVLMLPPLLGDLQRAYRVSLLQVLAVANAMYLVYGLAAIPAGFLADRFGSRRMLVAARAAVASPCC